jgi:tRNA(fMet)-specific endonuclease VapC
VTAGAPTRGLLDTSTVLLLGEITDPASLPDESVISAITLAELSVGPHVARNDDDRAARQQHLQQAEADFEVLPFDADCARALGNDFTGIPRLQWRPIAYPRDAEP